MKTGIQQFWYALGLTLSVACTPATTGTPDAGPVGPVACTSDSDCGSGKICPMTGFCATGAAPDPTASTVTLSKTMVTADGTDLVTIKVVLKDAAGNALSSRGVVLSATGTNNTLHQPVGGTDSVGTVTATLLSSHAEAKTISVRADVLPASTSAAAGVALGTQPIASFVGDASNLDQGKSSATLSMPTSLIANGTAAVSAVFSLRDAHNNPVPGVHVTVAVSGSRNTITLSDTAGNTGTDGTLTATITSTMAEAKTVTFTAGSVTISNPATFTPGPPDANNSSLVANVPTPLTADGAMTASLTLVVKDANQNPLAGTTAYFTSTGNANNFAPEATQADPVTTTSAGSVVVTMASTVAEVKTVTATTSSGFMLTAAITFTAGAPDNSQSQFLALLDPVVADGVARAAFGVQVLDAQQNAIVGTLVTVTSSDPSDQITYSMTDGAAPQVTGSQGGARGYLTATKKGSKVLTAHVGVLAMDLPTQTVPFVPGPPDPNSITFDVSPKTATTDPGNFLTVTLVVLDAKGNQISDSGVVLDADGVSNTLVEPTQSDGTYTVKLSSTKAQAQKVTASIGGNQLTPIPVTFTVGALDPNISSFTLASGSAATGLTANGAVSTQLTVLASDSQGNLIDAAVSFASDRTGPAFTNQGAMTTSGMLSTVVTSTKAGIKNISASVNGTLITQTQQLAFVAGAPDATYTTFAASPTSVADDGFATATLTANVFDGQQNPVLNAPVTFNVGTATVSPAVAVKTDVNGVATATIQSKIAGSVTVSATVNSFTTATKTVTFTTGPADSAKSTLTASQPTAVADNSDSITFTATLRDGSGQIINGQAVVFSSDGDGNTFTGGGKSNASGVVTATLKSTQAQLKTVSVATAGASPITFKQTVVTFTAGAAVAGKSTFSATPNTQVADNSSLITLTVTLVDTNDNPVPGQTVNFASDVATGDTFVPSGGVTDANGVLTVKFKATASGTHHLTASAAGLSLGPVALMLQPGAAAGLAFIAQPGNANTGDQLSTVTVQVQDQFGNAVSSSPASVTLALAPVKGTLNGTLTRQAAGNLATFSNLSVTGAFNYKLVATSGTLPPAMSMQFYVVPPFSSTGTAPYAPTASEVLPSGIHNYTTITIPAGVVITTDGNAPLELRASGAVSIAGTLDVSGSKGGSVTIGQNGGGGGGNAGAASPGAGANGVLYTGAGARALGGQHGAGAAQLFGFSGPGVLGGVGGGAPGGGGGGGGSDYNGDMDTGGGAGGGGQAGGGGGYGGGDGCVTAGGAGGGPNGGGSTSCNTTATGGGNTCGIPNLIYFGSSSALGYSTCSIIAGSAGGGSIGCAAMNDLAMANTFQPGSGGGGGGGGGDNNEPNASGGLAGGGGGGGGGGGALRITSTVSITISGSVLANGGSGGTGATSTDDCGDDSGGGGGGGSGGAIYLLAPVVSNSGTLTATGGAGNSDGSVSTHGRGGAGGMGRIRISYDPTQGLGSGIFNPPANQVLGTAAAGSAYTAQYPQ